jgi:hypothetical protein
MRLNLPLIRISEIILQKYLYNLKETRNYIYQLHDDKKHRKAKGC